MEVQESWIQSLCFNVVLWLIAGIFIFNEHHTLKQYVGGAIIFIAIILLAFDRGFEKVDTHTSTENEAYYLSLLLTALTWVVWAIPSIVGKYAMYYYNCSPIHFSNMTLFISGLFGMAVYLYIYCFNISFSLDESENFYFAIWKSMTWGALVTFASALFYKATSMGSVEIAQLFANLKSIVQVIEEFIFLHIFPGFMSGIIIILSWIGLILIIFSEEKKNGRSDETEMKMITQNKNINSFRQTL